MTRSEKAAAREVNTEDGYQSVIEFPGGSKLTCMPTRDGASLKPTDIHIEVCKSHPIVNCPSGIYHYIGTHWERIHERQVSAWMFQKDLIDAPSHRRRKEAFDQILSSTYHPRIEWRRLAPQEVPCHNGVLDVLTEQVRPHRPEDFLETTLPWDYDAGAKCSLWHKVLKDWWLDHVEYDNIVCAFQEFFGYILLPHAKYKKALFLYGGTDTGKSLVPEVITGLVGKENICCLKTSQMDLPERTVGLIGRMVNLITELPTDALIAEGGFKQLVSRGDAIPVRYLHQQQFSYIPSCKHVIACNTLPAVNDLTEATYHRLLILPFTRRFEGAAADKFLGEKLAAEMPGILAWAVQGAARLVEQQGQFTAIESSREMVEEYRAEQNPVTEFLATHTVQEEREYITMDEFRERFNKWVGGRPYSPHKVGRMCISAGAQIDVAWVAKLGRAQRCLVNYRWAQEHL